MREKKRDQKAVNFFTASVVFITGGHVVPHRVLSDLKREDLCVCFLFSLSICWKKPSVKMLNSEKTLPKGPTSSWIFP